MYGLLGRTLAHSFSPLIHSLLGNKNYHLFETDDLETFFRKRNFQGINVTIPYKEVVAPFLDEIDPLSQRTGSVNTIINRNNRLWGTDTDYLGLQHLLAHNAVDVGGKHVVILGNGGAAKTCECLMRDLSAASVRKLARNPKADNEFPFAELDKVSDCDIIINTTPVGMYPHNDDPALISLRQFPRLETVVDIIYNPLRSALILDAEAHGRKSIPGLMMLIAQAKAAHDLFFGKTTPNKEIVRIHRILRERMLNLVLIGMPMSGKSLYAHSLNNRYHKKLIDTDREIEKQTALTVAEIFEKKGEPYFREQEYNIVKSFYKEHGLMIATGGGMVQNHALMSLLKQNGLLIFIDKDKAALASRQIKNRPLIKNVDDVYKLYDRRHPLYEKYADIIIKIADGEADHQREIEAKIDEYLSGKRTKP